MLEKAAIREESLSSGGGEGQARLISSLSSEYYFLRITLVSEMQGDLVTLILVPNNDDKFQAWQQDRLELAEHMFYKVSAAGFEHSLSSGDNLSELLYDIGRDLLARKEYSDAETWLARAHKALAQVVTNHTSQNMQNLEFCVLHALGVFQIIFSALRIDK